MTSATSDRARRGRGRRGFTLIELLVVMFIILAMSAIGVAVFSRFLDTERLRLAAGQVTTAINLARQYAMSKRSKCLVEFYNPTQAPVKVLTKVLDPKQKVMVASSYPGDFDSSANTNWYGEPLQFRWDNRRVLLQFDLSTVAGTITSAKLKLNITMTSWDWDNVTVNAAKIADDTWKQQDSPPGSGVTWNTCPVTSGNAGTFLYQISPSGATKDFEVDVTEYIQQQATGDMLASMLVAKAAGGGTTTNTINSATLEVLSEQANLGADLWQLRILPYLKMRDPTTGGVFWQVDTDENTLRTWEMPANVGVELMPRFMDLKQYDPTDIADADGNNYKYSLDVEKRYFEFSPDGTCTAALPQEACDPENLHWNTVTWGLTVILRDANNGDLALIKTRPEAGFSRQRFIGGEELAAFLEAHTAYRLWDPWQ